MSSLGAAILAMVQKQIVEYGRTGSTGIIRIPDLAAAVPVFAAGVPGEVDAQLLTFNEDGYALSLYGQERTGTAAKFASTEVRLRWNAQKDLITSGQTGGAFFPMLGLFGPNQNWFPLVRRIVKNDTVLVSYRNFDAAAVANPTVGIGYLSDAEIDRMAAGLKQ